MRNRISPATLIASVALFFSLGGTGIAASHYLVTSVGQIKPSVRHALHGARGPQGIQGAVGPQGAPGAPGASPAAQHVYRVSSQAVLPADHSTVVLTAGCGANEVAISGGYISGDAAVTASDPIYVGYRAMWEVDAHLAPNAQAGTITEWAICMRVLSDG